MCIRDRAEGVEGGVLVLRHFLDLAVELGGGGLVDLAAIGKAYLADGLDDAEHADGIDIGGELGGVEMCIRDRSAVEGVDEFGERTTLVNIHLQVEDGLFLGKV